VIENGRKAAAHFLESAAADIEFRQGRFTVIGTDRGIDILALAERLRGAADLPADIPNTLDANHVFTGGVPTFPNGCHVAEVEIDPDTGVTEVVRYTAVNDFGNLVNPMIVEGQLHGGMVQGIGQAIMERTVYDEGGQLISGSFMDYAMPRFDNVPDAIAVISQPSPALTNPLGVKGCGEAGCAGSLPSIMNAVIDALSPYGIRHMDMPASPERVWQAIEAAKRKT
jgi:carbon-monoxide dehydrogenase large subunit